MTQQTHNILWHFTEKLTRDPDDRDELVLMAWRESEKLGARASIPLMINIMKLRAREMKTRSALGSDISGKSIRDAWNHDRVSLNKPVGGVERFTLEETLGTYYWNPLSMCIVNDFEDALPERERAEAVELLSEILNKNSSRILKIFRGGNGSENNSVKIFPAKWLKVSRKKLSEYYNQNKVYVSRINAAEFTDLLAYDHLCGYSKLLMEQIAAVPDYEIILRTKSSNVDELIKHDGHNRMTLEIGFNKPYVIDKYEHGTASFDARLEAAKKVQASRGIKLAVCIGPIVKYPGYEAEYPDLTKSIMKTLMRSSVADFSTTCVRYSGRLKARVLRNFPGSDLFSENHGLQKSEPNDRWRYPLSERTSLYKNILCEVQNDSPAYCRLGAETLEAWEELKMDSVALMRKSVHQYDDNK